jgi:protein-tyrosine-phosphatase
MWWDVEDPKFATREVSEKTYNQIKGLIENLPKRTTTFILGLF